MLQILESHRLDQMRQTKRPIRGIRVGSLASPRSSRTPASLCLWPWLSKHSAATLPSPHPRASPCEAVNKASVFAKVRPVLCGSPRRARSLVHQGTRPDCELSRPERNPKRQTTKQRWDFELVEQGIWARVRSKRETSKVDAHSRSPCLTHALQRCHPTAARDPQRCR